MSFNQFLIEIVIIYLYFSAKTFVELESLQRWTLTIILFTDEDDFFSSLCFFLTSDQRRVFFYGGLVFIIIIILSTICELSSPPPPYHHHPPFSVPPGKSLFFLPFWVNLIFFPLSLSPCAELSPS